MGRNAPRPGDYLRDLNIYCNLAIYSGLISCRYPVGICSGRYIRIDEVKLAARHLVVNHNTHVDISQFNQFKCALLRREDPIGNKFTPPNDECALI